MFPEYSLNVCLFAEEGLEPEERRRVAQEMERERADQNGQMMSAPRRLVADQEVRADNNSMHVAIVAILAILAIVAIVAIVCM
jgi:hypothetical protein